MTRHRSPAFESFLKEVEVKESACIYVTINCGPSAQFKIYVDGNVRVTPARLAHLRSPTSDVLPVAPGEHRIVVREAEINKHNRAQSNTLFVSLVDNEEIHLVLQNDAGELHLSHKRDT